MLISSAGSHVATTSSFRALTSSYGSLSRKPNETALSLNGTGPCSFCGRRGRSDAGRPELEVLEGIYSVMKVVRGYKAELDLNHKQITDCKKHAGAARYAYNWGLSRKQEVYQAEGRSITAMELHRELNQLKQTELPWMYEVSKAAPQEALRDLDKAMRNFFRRVQLKKKGKWKGPPGYPTFKTKRQGLGSFRLTGSIHVYEKAIDLPRLGRLRLKECGYLPTSGVHILTATVSEEAERWFVSLQVREEVPDPPKAVGEPIGVDLGITTMAVCSDGGAIENPKALRSELKRIRRLHRRFSRKRKGSNNRAKARVKLACKYTRIAHARRDALHKG